VRGPSWAWAVAAVGIASLVAVPSLAALASLAPALAIVAAGLVPVPVLIRLSARRG
jgi:hypothetical protein